MLFKYDNFGLFSVRCDSLATSNNIWKGTEADPDISIRGREQIFFRKKSDFKTICFTKNEKMKKVQFKAKITKQKMPGCAYGI